MTENEIAKAMVDSAFKIHTMFDTGLLESVYANLLTTELKKRYLRAVGQQAIPSGL
ncbi:MAG: hypothetical protein HY231_12680 [Acidobacteria bacterium]|nr:hypothetical protein [Acidobacteriota bacterium]